MLILEGLCGSVHRELDLERQVARLCVLPAPLTAKDDVQTGIFDSPVSVLQANW